jgi:hypothetical protein
LLLSFFLKRVRACFLCARIFARAFNNDLKTFFFWCKKQPVLVSFFSANKRKKRRSIDDEGFYLRKGRRENVVISLSLSLSLSLSPKKEFERERGGTRAANTHEKSFGRANVARQKPRAVERVCKMSKGQNEMREFRQKP